MALSGMDPDALYTLCASGMVHVDCTSQQQNIEQKNCSRTLSLKSIEAIGEVLAGSNNGLCSKREIRLRNNIEN